MLKRIEFIVRCRYCLTPALYIDDNGKAYCDLHVNMSEDFK